MIAVLRKIEKMIFAVEKPFLMVLLASTVLIAFSGIIGRVFFNKDFAWIGDFLQNMVIWLAFVGGTMGSRYNKHINVDIFPVFVKDKPGLKKILDCFITLFVMCVAGFLCYSAYMFVKMEYELGEDIPTMGMKIWIFQTILIYTFATVCFRYLLRFLESVTGQPLPEAVEEQAVEIETA
jgi:TRAP-type C4-dicarboxylate transport system permease small subunit